MLFDTDILIFVQRGREEAAQLVEHSIDRYIALVSVLIIYYNVSLFSTLLQLPPCLFTLSNTKSLLI
jgi:hypothetical protein